MDFKPKDDGSFYLPGTIQKIVNDPVTFSDNITVLYFDDGAPRTETVVTPSSSIMQCGTILSRSDCNKKK